MNKETELSVKDRVKYQLNANRTKIVLAGAGAATLAAAYYKGKHDGVDQDITVNLYPDNEPESKPLITGRASTRK